MPIVQITQCTKHPILFHEDDDDGVDVDDDDVDDLWLTQDLGNKREHMPAAPESGDNPCVHVKKKTREASPPS